MRLTPAELEQLADRVACIVASKLADAPLLIDKHELAKRTTLSVSTIERRVKDGQLPAVKVGRRVLFAPDAVLAALAANEEAPARKPAGASECDGYQPRTFEHPNDTPKINQRPAKTRAVAS